MITHRKIPQTEEVINLKLQLYNALNTVYMQPCKYPARIKEGYVGTSRVKNWGKGDRRPNHGGYGEFAANKKYPEAWKLLKEYAKFICPADFNYSMITVNKNVCMKKHLDSKNAGISYLTCFGDYEGGGLYIYPDQTKDERILFDTKNHVISFNGSKMPHETEPFNGSRFTLVFYSQLMKNKVRDPEEIQESEEELEEVDELEELVQLSLRWGVIEEHVDKLGWSVSKILG